MKLTVEETCAGTKVYAGKNHVKTIPRKYADIVKSKHILNHTRKRLTIEERFLLEVSLFQNALKKNEPFIYDLIKRSKPVAVQEVKINGGGTRRELIYHNGHHIKISSTLYWLSPKRLDQKFSNY